MDFSSDVISKGDYLIVKTNSVLRLIELRNCKPVFLGKRKTNLHSAIGAKYGTFFEIKPDGKLIQLSKPDDIFLKLTEDSDVKDNRSLWDCGDSQKLTTDDIEAFKAQGIHGQDMVKIILENSTTFTEKTSFAKEKYLRKKQRKYINCVQILKPTVRLIAEMLYMQGPLKISNLRIDSLSQMLTFGNVMSGGKYMVLETVSGLLTASVLEKTLCAGTVVQIHIGPFSVNYQPQAVKALKLDSSSNLFNIDFSSALQLLSARQNPNTVSSAGEALPSSASLLSIDSASSDDLSTSMACENMEVASLISEETLTPDLSLASSDAAASSSEVNSETSKLKKQQHIEQAKSLLELRNMDGLLVAVKHHPAGVLPLLDFLASSRPFVIFSMYQKPLIDCYAKLKSRGDVVLMNLSESWYRKYQVMSGRTHPDYTMSGNGGFLLTGIKVQEKL